MSRPLRRPTGRRRPPALPPCPTPGQRDLAARREDFPPRGGSRRDSNSNHVTPLTHGSAGSRGRGVERPSARLSRDPRRSDRPARRGPRPSLRASSGNGRRESGGGTGDADLAPRARSQARSRRERPRPRRRGGRRTNEPGGGRITRRPRRRRRRGRKHRLRQRPRGERGPDGLGRGRTLDARRAPNQARSMSRTDRTGSR